MTASSGADLAAPRRVAAGAALAAVAAAAAREQVVATPAPEVIGSAVAVEAVVAAPPAEAVGPAAAPDEVGVGTGCDDVVAAPGADDVAPGEGPHVVVPAAGNDDISSLLANQRVVPRGPDERRLAPVAGRLRRRLGPADGGRLRRGVIAMVGVLGGGGDGRGVADRACGGGGVEADLHRGGVRALSGSDRAEVAGDRAHRLSARAGARGCL